MLEQISLNRRETCLAWNYKKILKSKEMSEACGIEEKDMKSKRCQDIFDFYKKVEKRRPILKIWKELWETQNLPFSFQLWGPDRWLMKWLTVILMRICISRHPELKYFKPNPPWLAPEEDSSKNGGENISPANIKDHELERLLFHSFLNNRFNPSYTVGLAADSWLAYMDRLLTPGVESEEVWPKIEKLINIYYDALDAPKTGKKVEKRRPILKNQVHIPTQQEKHNSPLFDYLL